MANYVGIDLGTTYSAAAYIDATGRPTIIRNEDGDNITPSCVLRTGPESVEVGEQARRAYGFGQGEPVAARFKRDMGKPPPYERDYANFSPTEASALVLKRLKEMAETQIGQIEEAVVTVPANFDNEAREQTLAAAELAGLNVAHVINEPTAAAMYYGFTTGCLSGKYAVYDLGGGTFDVSIVQVENQDIKVLTSQGVQQLGGDDFDKAIMHLVQKKYQEEAGEPLSPDDFTMNDAEEVKRSLSRRERSIKPVNGRGIEVSRQEFEESISSLVLQTKMLCKGCLRELDLKPNDISGVLLVGGSTRVPSVFAAVKSVFKQEPLRTLNPDEAVALGAALYAIYKSDGAKISSAQKQSMSKLKLTEAARTNLGTICIGWNIAREEYELQNTVLIRRNSPLPVSETQVFYTVTEGQEALSCKVTSAASENESVDFVKILSEVELELPPNLPADEQIHICFDWREDNIVKATFKHPGSNRSVSLDLTMQKQDSNDIGDIERFTVE